MFIPITSLLTLLFMLIATTFSAPIHIPSTGSDSAHIISRHHGMETRSPILWEHQDRHSHLQLLKRNVLVPHPDELVSPSFKGTTKTTTTSHVRGGNISDIGRRGIWSRMKNAVKKVGNSVQNGVKRVGGAVKKVAHTIKNVPHRVVSHVKNAAKKVHHFVKQNGLKVAKVGLKAVAAGTKAASHVAALIPGVGTSVGKTLRAVSKVADFTGNQIHVSLGSKLDKVMRVMDKIQHPIGGAAGKFVDTFLKRDMEDEHLFKRGILDGEDLYQRSGELAVRAMEQTSQDGSQLAARMKFMKDI